MTEITRKIYSLLDGRLKLIDAESKMRPALDSILLGNMIPTGFKGTVLDVGCGQGAPTLMNAIRCPQAKFIGIDNQKELIEIANENATLNEIKNGSFEVADIKNLKTDFDAVITNPPFHQGHSPNAHKATAHHETLPLRDWVPLCLKRVRNGGLFGIVFPTERLMDIMVPLDHANMGKIEIHRHPETPKRLTLTAVKGNGEGVKIL
ncbi:MAG: methyltransferase domain-containing protein [Alphaproteobacteria bacterium]|nr:methyltransferase domain-containing protein [Alphaproteobacteria bacterium]MBN2779763.1 methyltransferase domain-containing protein [Alphaproteobacteria bacterium]